MRPASLQLRVFQLIIDVPTVLLKFQADPIPGQVPVSFSRIRLRDPEGLIASEILLFHVMASRCSSHVTLLPSHPVRQPLGRVTGIARQTAAPGVRPGHMNAVLSPDQTRYAQ